jgi:hypothetical protein
MLELRPHLLSRKPGLYPFAFAKEEIPGMWDSLEPMLERSVEHSHGMCTLESLHQWLLEGLATCIGTAIDNEPRAVFILRPVHYVTYTAARIVAAAGRDLGPSMVFFNVVEEWAHGIGASEVECWCRPAMVRLLQRYAWKRKGLELMTYDIRRKLQ